MAAINQFNKLETCDNLEAFFGSMKRKSPKREEYRHGAYFYYTTLNTMDRILGEEGVLWLTSVSGFNDEKDTEQFGEQERYSFALCLSTEKGENLPLWYLYAGADGCGARLRMTPGSLRKMFEGSECSLVREKQEKGEEEWKTEKSFNLERGKNVEIELRDVIYAGNEGSKKFILKYGIQTNRKVTKAEYEIYQRAHVGFHKGLLWQYEKESRLLAVVKGDAKRMIDEEKPDARTRYHIELKMTDAVKKSMRICLAPNIVEKNENKGNNKNKDFNAACDGLENIKKYYDKKRVEFSRYAGTVRLTMRNNERGEK